MRVTALAVAFFCLASNGQASGVALGQPNTAALVRAAAAREGIPEALAVGVIEVESRFKPYVVGSHGEVGLGQIKMATARGVGYRGTRRGLFDPETNLTFSFRYLRLAMARASGDWATAASLYNRGISARPRVTDYGRRVLAAARRAGKAAEHEPPGGGYFKGLSE